MRTDYEKKLKDQAMNYEKLINGLKSGDSTLTNTAIQFVDRMPEPYRESRRESKQNISRLERSSRLENSSRLESSNRLEASNRL